MRGLRDRGVAEGVAEQHVAAALVHDALQAVLEPRVRVFLRVALRDGLVQDAVHWSGPETDAEGRAERREAIRIIRDLEKHGERVSVTKILHQNVLKTPLKTMVQPNLPSQICPAKSLKLLSQDLPLSVI